MQVIGMIRRTFEYADIKTFLTLYKSYTRPHLEYYTQVWCPYKAKDIDILRVQGHATKLVPELTDFPYESRLQQLGLHSSYCRRLPGDLIAAYKLINKFRNVNYNSFP